MGKKTIACVIPEPNEKTKTCGQTHPTPVDVLNMYRSSIAP